MDKKGLREIEQLNLLPFNRKARRMLEERGEVAEPTCLHSVQLALWAVRKGLVEVDAAVSETLRAMTAWNPDRLKNFFMLPEGKDVLQPAGWEEAAGAEDLAALTLDSIEAKMLIHFPWYYDLC
ncbi:MAG: hypothetical protein ABSC19_10665 [Syntrophorhabdales bacterium]|jgi:hypothetical protein